MSFNRVIHFLMICSVVLTMEVYGNWSSEESQNRKHVVRPGETLSVIARNYGFELQELIHYNQLENPTRLEVGQVLYFPEEVQSTQSLPIPTLSPTPATTLKKQPEKALNAASFPPANAKPSPEEYYQLQQYMTSQGKILPTNEVDYNYPQKEKSPEIKPTLHNTELNEKELETDVLVELEAEQKEKAEPVTEELIDDKASPALAAFGDRPYAYFGGGEELVDVIQNFSASYYIPTIIAEDVGGEVNGKIGPLTPVDFLDHLANIYGFIWYFDGHTLYVYNGNAADQKIISLSYLTVDQFKATLKKVGIWMAVFFGRLNLKKGWYLYQDLPVM